MMAKLPLFLVVLICVICMETLLVSLVASESAASNCSFGSYDFSSFASQPDLVGLSADYSEFYYLRLCGTVGNLWCQLNGNTQSSSACQVNAGDLGSTFNLMNNQTNLIQWSWVNNSNPSAGVLFTAKNGDDCGTTPRQTIGILTCGNTTAISYPVVENPTCVYNLNITTPILCKQLPEERIDRNQKRIGNKLGKLLGFK